MKQFGPPAREYTNGSNALFERTHSVDSAFNRILIYSGNALHAADIDGSLFSGSDNSQWRLTISSLIRALHSRYAVERDTLRRVWSIANRAEDPNRAEAGLVQSLVGIRKRKAGRFTDTDAASSVRLETLSFTKAIGGLVKGRRVESPLPP